MKDALLRNRFPSLYKAGWNLFSKEIIEGKSSCTLFSIIEPLKDKKNMLLLHGLGTSWNTWANSVEKFAPDYNIYLLDMPWNSANPCPFTTLKELVEWTFSVIKTLEILKPIVITHSYGGIIILNMLGMIEPKMFDKLIVCSLGWMCGGSEEDKTDLYKRFVGNFNDLIYSSLMSGIRPGTDPDIINHMCKRVSETLDQNIIRDYFNIGHQNALTFPENVDFPLLLITGEDDFLALKEDSIFINQKIKGSEFISIPKAKHFPMAETKEAFYEIIHRFCKEESIF